MFVTLVATQKATGGRQLCEPTSSWTRTSFSGSGADADAGDAALVSSGALDGPDDSMSVVDVDVDNA
jgi:hypothetical protein